MNESIDLTLRKIFLKKLDNGSRASFDDESAYTREFGIPEYGYNFFKEKLSIDSIFANLYVDRVDPSSILKDDPKNYYYDHCLSAYHNILDRIVPENYYMGLGRECDCCGVNIHLLNSNGHFLCIECDEGLRENVEGSNILG